jgi:hypothetical protein
VHHKLCYNPTPSTIRNIEAELQLTDFPLTFRKSEKVSIKSERCQPFLFQPFFMILTEHVFLQVSFPNFVKAKMTGNGTVENFVGKTVYYPELEDDLLTMYAISDFETPIRRLVELDTKLAESDVAYAKTVSFKPFSSSLQYQWILLLVFYLIVRFTLTALMVEDEDAEFVCERPHFSFQVVDRSRTVFRPCLVRARG